MMIQLALSKKSASPAAVDMMLLWYCGWLWCCYYYCCCLALSSLVTCNEKTKEKSDKKEKKPKTYTSSSRTHTRRWKNAKQRKNEKRDRNKKNKSQKSKKANNFGRVPQHIISSSAITGWERLRGGRICRACPPKWARSKYVYILSARNKAKAHYSHPLW